MAVPPIDDVKDVLTDFEDRIRHVIERAWQEWLDFPDRARFVFMRRMRATFVFDRIAGHAISEFSNDENIRVLIKKQTVQFLFKDKVIARFKMSNAKGVGSNIPTQAVLDFVDPQGVIPGLVPEIMKVEIGYRPDDLGLSLDEVAVIARNRHRRIWAYPIQRGGPSAEVVPIPPRSPDATPPTVVPRRPAAEEDEKSREE